MVYIPSWPANWFAASQEIPLISRNPKVHYRTHKRPPPVCILGQPNPVRIPTSHLLEIHPNIIHPSTPRFAQWSPTLRFPHQDLYTPSPHPHAPYAQPISFFSMLSPAQYWVRSTKNFHIPSKKWKFNVQNCSFISHFVQVWHLLCFPEGVTVLENWKRRDVVANVREES
jgi:hypothetical protein